MKKRINKGFLILLRYLILLGLMFSLPVIYYIFTPLTVNPVVWLLRIVFEQVILINDVILINQIPIQIIPACIAGSAYLLILILNLTVPIGLRKRIYSILLSFLLLLILNILRIFILAVLYVQGFEFFDFTHKLFWYVLSIVFVILIWFFVVRVYNIKKIPVYSDVRYLKKYALDY